MGETHDEYKRINLHLDCDNFLADLLLKDAANPKTFTSTRMVPSGDRKYFFSIAGKEYCAKDQPCVAWKRFEKDIMTDKSKESARQTTETKDGKKLEEEAMQFDFTRLDQINVL